MEESSETGLIVDLVEPEQPVRMKADVKRRH